WIRKSFPCATNLIACAPNWRHCAAPRAPRFNVCSRPPPPSRSSRSRRSSRTPPGRRAGLSQLVKFFHTKRNVDMISEMNEQIARAEAAVKALEEKHITHARAARQADA